MLEVSLVAGFMTGLAGSMHCVANCSGISLALMGPGRSADKLAVRFGTIQAGRMTAYALGGAFVGASNGAFIAILGAEYTNHLLRIGAAIVMAWTGLAVAGVAPSPHKLGSLLPTRLPRMLPFVQGESWSHTAFLLGMSWGMMPCGMVYLAILTAAFAGGAAWGAAYMVAFFFGTLPSLAATTFGIARGAGRWRASAALRVPIGLVICVLALASVVTSTAIGRKLCGQSFFEESP